MLLLLLISAKGTLLKWVLCVVEHVQQQQQQKGLLNYLLIQQALQNCVFEILLQTTIVCFR